MTSSWKQQSTLSREVSAFVVLHRGPITTRDLTVFVTGLETSNSKFRLYGIPGGKQRPGDATLQHTAVRLCVEEIGWAPPRDRLYKLLRICNDGGKPTKQSYDMAIFGCELEQNEVYPAVFSGCKTTSLDNPLVKIAFRSMPEMVPKERCIVVDALELLFKKQC